MAETMRDRLDGAPSPEPPDERRPMAAAIRLARDSDPIVAPVVRRVRHMLSDETDVTTDTAVQRRIREYLDSDPRLSAGHRALPRPDFERIVAARSLPNHPLVTTAPDAR